MPPEEVKAPDIPEPIPEPQAQDTEVPARAPAVEIPTPATEPTDAPQEATSAPVEPEPVPSEPVSPGETPTNQELPQTAQIPPNEPIATEPEPIVSAPAPVADTQPESPSAEASAPTPVSPNASASAPQAIPPQTGILHTARDLLAKARVSIQDRKRKKRDKIMQALNAKNKITNDEVEKLLHVSDATATRYLTALEREGKIQQAGKTGAGVVYSKL